MTTGQPGSGAGGTRVATLSASASGSIMAPSLASALAAGTWKVAGGTDAQQKALLSQVSAALQSGQPVSLAVRAGPNAGGGPTRILTTGTTFTTMTVTPSTVTVTTTTLAPTVSTPSKTTVAPAAPAVSQPAALAATPAVPVTAAAVPVAAAAPAAAPAASDPEPSPSTDN